MKAAVRTNQNNAGVYGTVTRTGQVAIGQNMSWVMPAFARLLGDARGNLWVLRDEESGARDVLDGGGRLIARASLPSGVTVLDITEDFVLGVEQDELGVEYVVLRQIVRGA